jgi:putative heme iron utilization protein
MATLGRHAGPPGAQHALVPEPSLAERARTLMQLGRIGSLATHSRKQPGFPFGSVMPYAADDAGRPVFLISNMAMHTQNLKADARASLLVMQEGEGDPLGAARVTLMGETLPVAAAETGAVRELYLSRYEGARYWVDFADPLAESSAGILRHMNQDHAEALLLVARAAGESDAERAVMTALDRLGFHVRLQSGERTYGARIGFPREVRTAAEVRAMLIEMVQHARTLQ